jgi:hypothetical protein
LIRRPELNSGDAGSHPHNEQVDISASSLPCHVAQALALFPELLGVGYGQIDAVQVGFNGERGLRIAWIPIGQTLLDLLRIVKAGGGEFVVQEEPELEGGTGKRGLNPL